MMSTGSASVNRALDILDFLGWIAPESVQLKEIAERLDLPESTAHRLLTSLTEKHYVRQPEQRGPYSLGWKVVLLARAMGTQSHLVKKIRPHLEELSHRVGYAVNLAVLSDGQVLYLDCLVPNDVVGLYSAPGSTFPVHATALGKAILAFLPSAEREVILSRLDLRSLTPQTITCRAELREALQVTAEQGYATDHGELKSGLVCVAAPVLDAHNHALAAISVTAQGASVSEGDRERVVAQVVAGAEEASRHFQYS